MHYQSLTCDLSLCVLSLSLLPLSPSPSLSLLLPSPSPSILSQHLCPCRVFLWAWNRAVPARRRCRHQRGSGKTSVSVNHNERKLEAICVFLSKKACGVCVRVCARVGACVCACVCVRVSVRVCVRVCSYMSAPINALFNMAGIAFTYHILIAFATKQIREQIAFLLLLLLFLFAFH